MANREAGERKLTIDGTAYTLKFSSSAFIELEDVLGLEAGELEAKMQAGAVGYRILRGMLWAATRKHHRREIRTLDEVTDLMDELDDFQETFTTLIEAYNAAQPGAGSDEEANASGESENGHGPKKSRKKSSPGSDSSETVSEVA